MYFKRLELHGFKSFAEPVSIDFTDGITCIVGPNGSGKSNVADAIKWVLGEQSPKNLRGGKMEEVIFAGTENRKARGIAEVTLVIDNKENILPIEYNEVAITRKMYRSGESEYQINGHTCRLKDIKELIIDTGMGVDGYSMIGQGRISEIVNNKADGRRELFEAAAGISKYRNRKVEAERKLSNSSGNLTRVNDILNEIEGRIDGLREDSIKASEYLKLSSRYKTLEINLAVRQAESTEKRIDDLKNELQIEDGQIKSIGNELSTCTAEAEALKIRGSEADKALEILREESEKFRNTVFEAENNLRINEERLVFTDKEISDNEKELAKKEEYFEKSRNEISELKKKKEELTEAIKSTDSSLSLKECEYALAKEKYTQKLSEIEEKKSDVFELHNGINIGKTEISGLQSLLEGLHSRKNSIAGELAENKASAAKISAKLDELTSEIDNNKEIKNQIINTTNELYSDLKEAGQIIENLESQKREKEKSLHNALTKRDLLIGFENSYEGFGYAIKYIMANRSRLSGIHGVVSELIDVPKGYETAVQTALGGGMQNIVCENDSSASDAVNLLKREKAGRATFLPVNSIRGGRNASLESYSDSIRKEAGFMGFAYETVSFDRKYSKIIEYLMGRTVIADNLDSAVRMSKKYRSGLRFVTLDGEDVNSGGAITGGRVKNGAPNVFERKNEIRALSDAVDILSDDISVIKGKLSDSTALADELRTSLDREKAVLNNVERTIIRENTEFVSLNERISGFKDSEKKLNNELAEIHQDINETNEMISEVNKRITLNLNEIEKHEDSVDEEVRLYDIARSEADALNEELAEIRIRLSSLSSELGFIDERIINTSVESEKAEKESLLRKEKILSLKAAKEEISNNTEALKGKLKNAEESLLKINAGINENKSIREKVSASLEEISDAVSGLTEKRDSALSKKHDIEIQITKSDTQLSSIINRIWDSFEVSYIEAKSMTDKDIAVFPAQKESREIKLRIRELEPVNISSIEEYKSVSERYEFMKEQRTDIMAAIDSLTEIIKDMDRRINARFMASFEDISSEFKKAFRNLFGGGTANLVLDNKDNILEANVEIIAQPPGKKLQNINLLSGGEKSLTAIALLCAILKVNPTPFVILDEVEAALDDINIDRFVDYIRSFEGVQFIVVTHQKVTMEKSDAMYGITMPEKGVSRVVSLRINN